MPASTMASITAKVEARTHHEELEEPEPQDLQGEEDAAEDRGGEQGAESVARNGRSGVQGRGPHRRPGKPSGQGQGQRSGEETLRRGKDARASHPQPLDEHELTHERTRDGAERVPPIQSTQSGAELAVVARERRHQDGEGCSHGRGGDQHQEEGDEEAQALEKPGVVDESAEERCHPGGERREEEHETEPRRGHHELEPGIQA